MQREVSRKLEAEEKRSAHTIAAAEKKAASEAVRTARKVKIELEIAT